MTKRPRSAGLEPLLVLGSKRMAELTKRAQEYGFVTESGVEHAKDLELAQRTLGVSLDGLRNRIADQLGPVITPYLNQLARWIATSPLVDRAIKAMGRGVTWLAGKLENLDWDDLSRRADEWGKRLLGYLRAIEQWSPPIWLRSVLGLPAADTGPNGPVSPLSSSPSTSDSARPDYAVRNSHPTALGRWLYDNFDRLRSPDNFLHGSNRAPRPPGWSGTYDAPNATQGTGQERNLRNNNPTNLTFAGQAGAVSDGRFARFKNMETGVAADLNQFLLYQDRDHLTSIAGMINKATPISENPGVRDYIDRVAKQMGVSPNAPINLHDVDTAKRFIMAVSPNEGGTPDAAAVERGVRLRLGGGASTMQLSDSQTRLAETYDRQQKRIEAMLPPNARGPAAQSPGSQGQAMPAPSGQAPAMQPPAAQGTPLKLNSEASAASRESTVRLQLEELRGFRGKVLENKGGVPVEGPLVETPALLGANP